MLPTAQKKRKASSPDTINNLWNKKSLQVSSAKGRESRSDEILKLLPNTALTGWVSTASEKIMVKTFIDCPSHLLFLCPGHLLLPRACYRDGQMSQREWQCPTCWMPSPPPCPRALSHPLSPRRPASRLVTTTTTARDMPPGPTSHRAAQGGVDGRQPSLFSQRLLPAGSDPFPLRLQLVFLLCRSQASFSKAGRGQSKATSTALLQDVLE